MTNFLRSNFQAHPFHLVSPSPWPILTCISLLSITTSGVLTMHSFVNVQDFLYMALFILVSTMSFWFRDVISEATYLGNPTLAVIWGLNNPPRPCAFVSLPLQSGLLRNLFKFITNRFSAIFTISFLISFSISIFMFASYKLTSRFMLGQLEWDQLSIIFNAVISLCSITIGAWIIGKDVSYKQIFFTLFFTLIVPLYLWYINRNYPTALADLGVLIACICNALEAKVPMGPSGGFILHQDAQEQPSSSSAAPTGGSGNKAAGESKTEEPYFPFPKEFRELSIDEIKDLIINYPEDFYKKVVATNALRWLEFDVKLKAELWQRAIKMSPPMQEIHHQAPERVRNYWHYRNVFDRSKIELNALKMLRENAQIPLHIRILMENREGQCITLRSITFRRMKKMWGDSNELNSKERKFLKKHMTDYIHKDSTRNSDSDADSD